jgi:hypothetical protein
MAEPRADDQAAPVTFTMTNTMTGETSQIAIDPAGLVPDCPNSLLPGRA